MTRSVDASETDPESMSTGQLIASIKNDMTDLVRGEVELAKAELRESAKMAGLGAALGAAAGYVALLATILLSIALGYGLVALGLHPGWAFLIAGGAYLLVAGLLGLIAISRFRRVHGPERAKRTATQLSQALRPRTQT